MVTGLLAIETKLLTKTYQGHGGCREISLAVPQGCIFGLLGPNGAGKSTLIKVLMGLLHPTSGEAKLLDRPLTDVANRKRIGFLPENFRYHDWLTGQDLLGFHAALFGMSKQQAAHRIPVILDLIGLTGQAQKQVGSYSKGMQQRIGLGCALLPDPDLLFLDEPTSALDPIGRKEVRDLLVLLRGQGKTIFLNSHLLSELETICDQIAIIKKGQLLFQGDWRELNSGEYRVKIILDGILPEEKLQLISLTAGCRPVSHHGAGIKQEYIFSCPQGQAVPKLVESIVEAGGSIHEVSPLTDSLEKLFLSYITDN